jgi:AraC-like DNA-binding protein
MLHPSTRPHGGTPSPPNRNRHPVQSLPNHRQGLVVGETTVGLLGAAMRMLELLDTPEDIPFLGPLAHREILYRILRTPQAGRPRAIATSGDLVQRTARAISWLRENYAKPLRIEELASTARMGVSTLHHQFRALTGMSPLQYQKQLRLQTARQRMLMDGFDATKALASSAVSTADSSGCHRSEMSRC